MDHSMGTGTDAATDRQILLEKFRWPRDLFLVEYLETEKQKNLPEQKSATKRSDTIMQERHWLTFSPNVEAQH
jgi:hypothetical protein